MHCLFEAKLKFKLQIQTSFLKSYCKIILLQIRATLISICNMTMHHIISKCCNKVTNLKAIAMNMMLLNDDRSCNIRFKLIKNVKKILNI